MRPGSSTLSIWFICLWLCLSSVSTAFAQDEDANAECLGCHAEAAALEEARTDPTREIARLLVDPARYARSVHSSKSCDECHFDFEDHPHSEDVESVTCAECHDDAGEAYASSVHGQLVDDASKDAPSCATCHGVHDVLPSTDRESRLHPLNHYAMCGQCHMSVDPATASIDQMLADPYTRDSHANGILSHGLTVSATCVSCHGGHETRAMGDPESKVSRDNVAETCGQCHVAIVEQYEESVHHLRANGGGQRGATCSDCHLHHDIRHADAGWRSSVIDACSKCHEKMGGTFRQSYHGKRSTLGFDGKVADCAACHGAHAILAGDDPGSPIHADNLVATCAECHPGAHEEFTNYLVHVDISDGENYPTLNLIYTVMTWLLVTTIILGCLHALLWLIRALAAGEWRRPPQSKTERYIRRWPRVYIWYHMVLMTTVLFLAATGLPLHFAGEAWADDLMNMFGGVVAAGWVHRVAAVAIIGLVIIYLIHTAWRLLVKREKGLLWGPNSMTPRWKDLTDLFGNIRWFLFLGERPRYDRWTYWEKFDFWAVFWGMFIIGTSGLILWFPVQATRFVPGWFVNAAVIVHGIEALLDIAFIFTVHVFHANLRPDKFPMDTMYLSGRIPESEFRHERPEEYDRAVAAGTLDDMVGRTPARRTRIYAYVIGSLALAVGFFFLIAFVVAVMQHGMI